MPTIEGDLCPQCRATLTLSPDASEPDAPPWCGDCEWGLDHVSDDRRHSWFWRRTVRSDRQAGFASHRELATSTEATPVGTGPFRLLVTVSAVLMVLMLAILTGGLWLIAGGGGFWPVVAGLALLALAALLRPRFIRLRRLLKSSYRVEPAGAPTVHLLIDRLAEHLHAPRPDVLLFDFSWNAGVITVGPRPRRVLRLGVPLLLALTPQEVVALIGHELGHLKHADTRRLTLTAPARATFGRLSSVIRPPRRIPLEIGLHPGAAVFMVIWQISAGLASWLLFRTHLALNKVGSRDDRTVELRADAMAAEAAGSVAALRLLDLLAMQPMLTTYVQRFVPRGEASATWRRMLHSVRERETASAPTWRQLSIRTDASLFASHPAPGRRYQWLAARPGQEAAVTLGQAETETLEREIRPYAEALHRTMLKNNIADDLGY